MRRYSRLRDDDGMSMVLVVGSMMTLMILVLGSLAYTMRSEKLARYDQDYTSAMSAAQAGVDDYISRLNAMNAGELAKVDCANAALRGPNVGSNTCGWGAATPRGWTPVTAGADVTQSPAFHYEVDSSDVYTQGTVKLTVTGRSREVYRTVEVAVGKGGSTDYVYYTDFENADPANKVYYPSGASVVCGRDGGAPKAKYFWDREGRSGCTEITFISSDTLDGRVFSNDAILSSNAQFQMGIESANPRCKDVTASTGTWNACLRSGSTGRFGKQPKYGSPLYLPDNSGEFATHPGCHYYGATRVIFNADGTMRVWSKDSDFTGAVLAIPDPNGTTPSCGTAAALASDEGATVPVPDNMVVYAHSSPTSGPGAVTRRQLWADDIGGPTNATKLPLGSYTETHAGNPTGSTSYTYDRTMKDSTKLKGEGNLYVEGVLQGRVTVAAEQSVIVTGDVVLAGGMNGSDMLGLVATNSVEVMHPRMETVSSYKSGSRWYWNNPTNEQEAYHSSYTEGTWPTRYNDPDTGSKYPSKGIQIAGSIQTLQHSFYVQEYNKGSNLGTLLVRGSIAQRWRGAVGQGSGSVSSGYSKLYTYDKRLQFSSPPYFPHWANSEWSLRYSGESRTPTEVKAG